MEISKTGLWINPAGELVDKAPERGTQVVAPGGVIDDIAQRIIDNHEDPAEEPKAAKGKGKGKTKKSKEDPEHADGPEPPETRG